MDTSDLPTFFNLPTTLFTLRIWHEIMATEPGTVRIQVKHVLSGETRYFQDWTQLTTYLAGKVQPTKQLAPSSAEK